ncbi:hypothetical protein D3C78_1159280 [compost metagenome]
MLFGDKILVIVETVRIQQAQAGEVALLAELFRGGGQQQHAGNVLSQLFDDLILAAWCLFAPGQVVGFIDHQQIPLGVGQLFQAQLVATDEVQRADHQLFGFKRVAAVELGLGVTAVVEQREIQVEAAHHFDQPLVLEVFRHHDQYALGAACQQLLVNDHPGFDGFTQTHLICQQYARRMALADFIGDV